MRAAVYYGNQDVRVASVPEPREPGPQEVLLRVRRASLCGTDVSEYLHGPLMIPLHDPHPVTGHRGPTILGHEFVGEVVACGPEVGFREGQRVVCGAGVWCGACPWCRAGRTNLCARYYTLGLHAHGGLAEFVCVPARTCVEVPETCSDEAAAIAQPTAVAVHALRRSGWAPGMSLVVIGTGGIGSLLVGVARAWGGEAIVAVDVDPHRLELAERVGASRRLQAGRDDVRGAVLRATRGEGAEVVVDSSGAEEVLEQATGLVRQGGTILQVGLPHRSPRVPVREMVLQEICWITAVAHVCDQDLPEAIRILASTDLANRVVDRVIPLGEVVPRGLLALVHREAAGKVVVDPSG
ncbi:MAG: alcohol dehydrogenase catalytic domain-containing protein [Armatimonadetes bacterium]|nr:alcohol dehydrogenase catalytic domain-containing protein [Armatimonadota bacterium]MDW8152643.1 alcohol dehydrogenase catalytic domain-containing protein [Armatimonadota bacterium]